jgi:hypothetical protein
VDLLRQRDVHGLYSGVAPSLARAFLVSASRCIAYEDALRVLRGGPQGHGERMTEWTSATLVDSMSYFSPHEGALWVLRGGPQGHGEWMNGRAPL